MTHNGMFKNLSMNEFSRQWIDAETADHVDFSEPRCERRIREMHSDVVGHQLQDTLCDIFLAKIFSYVVKFYKIGSIFQFFPLKARCPFQRNLKVKTVR